MTSSSRTPQHCGARACGPRCSTRHTREALETLLRARIGTAVKSPARAAYALDDEASWGSFVQPAMWQVKDDPAAYPRWLAEIYGPAAAPKRDRWMSYEDSAPSLQDGPWADFDASPLLDQWSFNDSQWCNFLGGLVEFANVLDPATPCGVVGGANAEPVRRLRLCEAHAQGAVHRVLRSRLRAGYRRAPLIRATRCRRPARCSIVPCEEDVWQIMARSGARQSRRTSAGWRIGSTAPTPKPWHAQLAPTLSKRPENRPADEPARSGSTTALPFTTATPASSSGGSSMRKRMGGLGAIAWPTNA